MTLLADTFATVTALIIFGGVLLFLAIGRWHSRSGTEIMDEDRKERWGVQAAIEERDIGEMVDADNERKRERGEPETSREERVDQVSADEVARLDSAPDRPGDS